MNQDELLALIGHIYDAAVDASRWPGVLEMLADAFGAREASLSAVSPRSVPWLVAPRTDPEYLQSYGSHYHPLNLFWQCMTRVPVGVAVTDAMVLPKTTLHASPFFNEWSRPQGYVSVMGATLLAEDDWRVEFVLPGEREFGPDQLRLYEAVGPHLRRAVQLSRRLQAAAMDRVYSVAALDSIAQGMVIVDRNARVLLANRGAESAFGNGLVLADGVLCSSSASETARLHSAIGAAAEFQSGSRDYVQVSRGPDRRPLALLVIPFRAGVDGIAQDQSAAIIFIGDPDSANGTTPQHLQEQFGLTRAEATLVHEMLNTESLQAAADRLGIKIATARTHVHRVLAKTGTKSQADLMRLLLKAANWAQPVVPNRNGARPEEKR